MTKALCTLLRPVRFFVLRTLVKVRRHPVGGWVFELVDGMLGDFVRDHSLMYAAAVAFYTLLSMIPLLIIVASATGYAMLFFGTDPEQTERVIGDLMEQIRAAAPFLSGEMADDLRGMLENRESLGLVGTVALLFSASQVFRALEFSFARIFARSLPDDRPRSAQPRNVFLSKLFFSLFLLAMLGGYFVLKVLISLFDRVEEALPEGIAFFVGGGTTETLLSQAFSAALIALWFLVLLKIFTTHRIHGGPALIGGLFFALAWQLSRTIYLIYLVEFSDIGALYGGFSAVMATVLWIFVTSVLLQYAAHLTKVVQRRRLYGPAHRMRGALSAVPAVEPVDAAPVP